MRTSVFAALSVLVVLGCATQQAQQPPAETKLQISQGTPVSLVLLQELESGVSEEGASVRLIVAKDVAVDGKVAIPKGSEATGKVAWSRRENALGALAQRPARLDLELLSITTAGGTQIPIRSGEGEEPKIFRFDRSNTGRIAGSEKLEKLVESPEGKQSLEEITKLFQDGRLEDLDSPENKEKLLRVAQELGLTETEDLLKQGEIRKAGSLLQQIRSGASIAAISSGGTLAALGAATELAELAGGVTDRLSGMLRGRNIKAYVGTTVPAEIAEDITVTIK